MTQLFIKTHRVTYRVSNKRPRIYSEAGSDIVCSAVSAIIYTALGGMDELAGFKSFQQKDGLIKCFVPGNLTRDQQATTQIILKTMDIGLRQVEADYHKYVRVRYEEV